MDRSFMHRQILALAAALLLAACGLGSQPAVSTQPLKIRVAYTSNADMEDIPSLIAHDRLREQGYEVEEIFYAQPELAVAALADGKGDFAAGSARTFWAGVSQGAEIVTIMEHASNSWTLVAVPEIQTCADLAGQTLAIHSDGSIGKALVDAYIYENCPGVEPEFVIIAGSENRAAALLAGEITVTPLELADVVQLDLKAPGKFHTIVNFAQSLPNLVATPVYVSQNFATEHANVVKDYIRARLEVYRTIAADHKLVDVRAAKVLEIDKDLLPKVVAAEFEAGGWDVNGGLTVEAVQYSLDFFIQSGGLGAGLTAEKIADLSFLNSVLDDIGRQ